jgi:hypothetical protein
VGNSWSGFRRNVEPSHQANRVPAAVNDLTTADEDTAVVILTAVEL